MPTTYPGHPSGQIIGPTAARELQELYDRSSRPRHRHAYRPWESFISGTSMFLCYVIGVEFVLFGAWGVTLHGGTALTFWSIYVMVAGINLPPWIIWYIVGINRRRQLPAQLSAGPKPVGPIS